MPAAAGCVTVVIVPRCVDAYRRRATARCAAPSRSFSNGAVRWRSEVHVAGPRYTAVSRARDARARCAARISARVFAGRSGASIDSFSIH